MASGASGACCHEGPRWDDHIACHNITGASPSLTKIKKRRISIDGHTEISFTEDVAARFVALGWHVQHVKDGNTDLAGLRAALDAAKKDPRPSFIKARSSSSARLCKHACMVLSPLHAGC